MQTSTDTTCNWDYTDLAAHYDKRADYVAQTIDTLFEHAGLSAQDQVADIGAGTGKLCKELLARELQVHAVEPNDAMRGFGQQNTESFGKQVTWSKATGESTGLAANHYRAVWFGSSFNVCDQQAALTEAKRLLVDGGYFICLWNHRDLTDPVQQTIEQTIQKYVPAYNYGKRRQDQSDVIAQSQLFHPAVAVEHTQDFQIPTQDYLTAWRSHATLQRQAGDQFTQVIGAIQQHIPQGEHITVPYTTRAWIAKAN